MKQYQVYLAGGFHSGWQDQVIALCNAPDVVFNDPRKFRNPRPENTETRRQVFTTDRHRIENSDILIHNNEATNPGVNCFWEAAYAKGLGLHVICIYEYHDLDAERYQFFAQYGADTAWPDLSLACNALNDYIYKRRQADHAAIPDEVNTPCAERRMDVV